jgi:hypothetical protein
MNFAGSKFSGGDAGYFGTLGLPAPDVQSTAQARGYAMVPNGAALRYEFMRYRGRP